MSEKNSNDSDDLKDKAASEDAVGREEIDSGKETETRAAAGTESAGRKKLPQLPPRARRFCAFLVGVVFFMSGALKLMDPVGTGLIMEEYFKFLHVGFLSFAAKSSGALLAFIETMSGVALITGVWRRFTACVVSVFMGLFTLLTLLLLIFNPSMDCGCFGEAVHLTHAQSFLKNVVIDVLIFAAFWPFKSFGRNKRRKYVAFSLVSVAVVALMLYSLLYIPLIDFTDFKPGVRLAAADVRSHGGGDDAYEAVFIYEKDGERETFTLDNLPDSTWTYVSTETRSRNASADELMPALSFSDAAGEYHDELAVHKDVMIVSMFRPSDADAAKWSRTASFVNDALDNGFFPLVLVSGTPESVRADFSEAGLDGNISSILSPVLYYADYKTLISLNRSNGGVTYFNRGYLVKKWSYSSMPDNADLAELASGDVTETFLVSDTAGSLTFQGFLLYSFAVMLLL